MLVLSRPDLERLLPPLELVDALAEAFRVYARGSASVPLRTSTPVTADGLLLLMPAAAPEDRLGLGVKLVTYYGGNAARGRPTLHATYCLMDGETGAPLALLEGTFLTALRTGATSALAARLLARPDSERAVCFGAGVQARFQLRCLAAVLPLKGVTVIGRDATRARRFCDLMTAELGIPVETGAAHEAVPRADLITCATTSATPVLFGAAIRPGTHVDAVGAFRATDREVDAETVRRARVVVDTYAAGLEEAGDVILAFREGVVDSAHLVAELAELVTGAKRGRLSPDDITLFKSVGFALEDLAGARLAYNRAMAQGIGTEVRL
ncbi:MAG TPA: ornithine cyclodeaminase family protein [Methylomirabilota bacterium]